MTPIKYQKSDFKIYDLYIDCDITTNKNNVTKLNNFCLHFNMNILEYEFDDYCWLGLWTDNKFKFIKHFREKQKKFKKMLSYLYNMSNKYYGADRDTCEAIIHQICLPVVCYMLSYYGTRAPKILPNTINLLIKKSAKKKHWVMLMLCWIYVYML